MSVENTVYMKDVCKRYKMGETVIHALKDVDLAIPHGDFVSIVGPSGSGKSTLLNMIGCIDVPDCGVIRILKEDTKNMKDRDLTRLRLEKIGFIFQQFYLIPTLRAIENVELPMKELGMHKHERRERARNLLESVHMEHRAEHYPNQLSGGEQQRTAIARALANEPEILLADEPTGEVDSKTAQVIVDLLKELNQEKEVVVIMVTHDLAVGSEAKRMIKMKDGAIVSDR